MDIDIHERAPEHKAGVPAEALGAEDVMRIFEAYKQENDERLAAIDKRKPRPADGREGRAHGCAHSTA